MNGVLVQGLGLVHGRLHLDWGLSGGGWLGILVKGFGLVPGRLRLDWGLSGGVRLRVLAEGLGPGGGSLRLAYILTVRVLSVLGSSAFMVNGSLGGAPGPPLRLSVPWRLWV